jgi:hypothetical protein
MIADTLHASSVAGVNAFCDTSQYKRVTVTSVTSHILRTLKILTLSFNFIEVSKFESALSGTFMSFSEILLALHTNIQVPTDVPIMHITRYFQWRNHEGIMQREIHSYTKM